MKTLIFALLLVCLGCSSDEVEPDKIGCVSGIPQNGTERVIIGCITAQGYSSFVITYIGHSDLQFDPNCGLCK